MKPELVAVKFVTNTKGTFATLRVNLSDEENAPVWEKQVLQAVKAWNK